MDDITLMPNLRSRENQRRWERRQTKEGRSQRQKSDRKYRANPEHKEQQRIINKTYEQNHYRSRLVKAQLYYALATGKIIKPDICSQCGKVAKAHGHHNNYDKPLDVIWLCPSCHKLTHIANAGMDL